MASTFYINVVINPAQAVRGSRTIRRELGEMEAGAQRLFTTIRRALLLFGAASIARDVIALADDYTRLQNRIATVTESTGELAVVTKELFDIAERTRVGISSTAELYARGASVIKQFGGSTRDALQFIESFNQALTLSGSSAQEAEGATRQFLQGISSNFRASGQELNSIIEQAPVLADVIAKEMGVARFQLKLLASQGKLTAKDVIRAFQDAREELEERFSKTLPTIGQAFIQLRNRLVQFVGETGKTSGATQAFVRTIQFVAENIEVLVRLVTLLATTLLTQFALIAVGKAVTATVKLISSLTNLRTLLTSFPAIIGGAFTFGIGLIVAFGDQIKVSEDGLVSLQDVAVETFKAIADAGGDAVEIILAAFQTLGDVIIQVFKGIAARLTSFQDAYALSVRGQFAEAAEALESGQRAADITQKTIGAIPDIFASRLKAIDLAQIVDSKTNLLNATAEEAGSRAGGLFATFFTKGASAGFAQLMDSARGRAAQNAAEAAKRAAEEAAAAAQLGAPGVEAGDQAVLEDLFSNTIERLEDEAEALAQTSQNREVAIELIRIEQQLRRKGLELGDSVRTQIQLLLEEKQAAEDYGKVLDELRGPQERWLRDLAAINRAQREGQITQDQYNQKIAEAKIRLLEAGRAAEDGFHRGFLKAQLTMTDFAAVAEDTVTHAFANIEDGFVGVITLTESFGEAFSRLIDGILQDLARLLVRQALGAFLGPGTAAGGALAGLFGGGLAGGGDVQAGKLYMIGEKGPELFAPGMSGAVIPNDAFSGAFAPAQAAPTINVAPTPVNVTIVNAVDIESEVDKYMTSRKGEKRVLNAIGRNQKGVKQTLAR